MRALREFANRCEGGAFFLLNPMYQTPYLPCRPEPRDPWDLSHQAVWEADGIISDTPYFAPWANACEDVSQLAQVICAPLRIFSDAIDPTMSFMLGTVS